MSINLQIIDIVSNKKRKNIVVGTARPIATSLINKNVLQNNQKLKIRCRQFYSIAKEFPEMLVCMLLIFLINVQQYSCMTEYEEAIKQNCIIFDGWCRLCYSGFVFIDGKCIRQETIGCNDQLSQPCQNATKNCVSFEIKLGRCYECEFGYKVNEDGLCVGVNNIDDNIIGCCESWDCVNLLCFKCCPGWYKTNAGTCKPINRGCSLFDQENGVCYKCNSGYKIDKNIKKRILVKKQCQQ